MKPCAFVPDLADTLQEASAIAMLAAGCTKVMITVCKDVGHVKRTDGESVTAMIVCAGRPTVCISEWRCYLNSRTHKFTCTTLGLKRKEARLFHVALRSLTEYCRQSRLVLSKES